MHIAKSFDSNGNSISYEKAVSLVEAHLNSGSTSWHLEEFDAGWLVRLADSADVMGAASLVVEKADGKLRSFPSSIPPRRIVDDYTSVQDRGAAK